MKSLFRSKKTSGNLEESLENLQVSNGKERVEDQPSPKKQLPILRTHRRTFDISAEEASWLLKNVFKKESSEVISLRELLRVFGKDAVEKELQESSE